jgi:hypothetical protein
MRISQVKLSTFWNTVLVITVMIAAFILPVIEKKLHFSVIRLIFSLLFFSAIFSLKEKSKMLVIFFVITLLLEWISGIANLPLLLKISNGVNILFFLFIVFMLIGQIASSKYVTPGVILGSVAGYLLLGIIYSIFISFILEHDPAAFNVVVNNQDDSGTKIYSDIPLYWGFVTMASLGYGDIVPLKPYTRSLATFIVISGQFYMAIIVALLVGKFTSQKDHSKSPG